VDIKKRYPLRRACIWFAQIAVSFLVLFIAGKCSAESLRDYYPLQVGNEWQYIQSRYREGTGLKDTSYVHRKIHAIASFEGKEYFEITEGQRVFYQRYNVSGDTLWEYDEDRQQKSVKYYVVIDSLEEYTRPFRQQVVVFDGWVLPGEPVATPAGFFEDTICYLSYRYYEMLFGSSCGESLWFARNIGLIRVYRWQINEIHQISQGGWSLIYAKVGGVEYGTKLIAIQSLTWGQIKSLFR
jgi:hypothetical protein